MKPLKLKFRVGPVICLNCERTWVAMRPKKVKRLECPRCGELQGVPRKKLS